MSKAVPPGYRIEYRKPVTPFNNPWVIYFNDERVGSAPTEAGARKIAREDSKTRKV
jgi:hypothetical protein